MCLHNYLPAVHNLLTILKFLIILNMFMHSMLTILHSYVKAGNVFILLCPYDHSDPFFICAVTHFCLYMMHVYTYVTERFCDNIINILCKELLGEEK